MLLSGDPLPRFDIAGNYIKEGVGVRLRNLFYFGEFGRGPQLQLSAQVGPLVKQLSSRRRYLLRCAPRSNLRCVKAITSRDCFLENGMQVSGDCLSRISLIKEPDQLWMTFVTPGLVLQDFLREQCFSPQSHQPLSIEIAGVNCPETHSSNPLSDYCSFGTWLITARRLFSESRKEPIQRS